NIRYAQGRDDRQQLALGVKALAFEQRARQTGVERQTCHGTAAARNAPLGIERLQLLQQPVAVVERSPVGRVDERKILRLTQTVRGQAQQQRGEIRAQYFGFGERFTCIEVGLR